MIIPYQNQSPHRHAMEPLVQALMRTHAPTASTLQAAWESVLLFVEETDQPYLQQPDAVALLYAKALAACNQPEAARHIASLAPCALPLARYLNVESIPLNTIRTLAAGVLRPVMESALSRGLVLIVDGERFLRDVQFGLDLALLPALRSLVQEAMTLLSMCKDPGLLLFRGWSLPDDDQESRAARRDIVEAYVEQAAEPDRRPGLIWLD